MPDKNDPVRGVFQANCPHCRTKQVAFQKKADIYWPVAGSVERHVDVAAQCGHCSRGIIVPYIKIGNAAPRYMGELYPLSVDPAAPEHTPDNVARFYIQGLENLPRNWDAAGTMFRKALETGLKAKFPNKTGTLNENIKSAKQAQKITPEMAKWAHKIRGLGNSATHDEEPWTQKDAQEIKDFTELVFQYLFTLPGMMEKARPKEGGE